MQPIKSRLNNREAAEYIGISGYTLKLSRHTGSLCGKPAPAHRKLGRLVVYDKATIDAWIEQFPEVVGQPKASSQESES